jgi:glyoxylase I family protein
MEVGMAQDTVPSLNGFNHFSATVGIEHTGIRDEKEPFPYSTVVFRDPDNIQLQLVWS